MSDKYSTDNDPDCYPGTSILRNLLDLRDPALLQQAEAEFAATAADAIEIGIGPFDLAYLCNLHQQLFDEVYAWAGKPRQVDIAKATHAFVPGRASSQRLTHYSRNSLTTWMQHMACTRS